MASEDVMYTYDDTEDFIELHKNRCMREVHVGKYLRGRFNSDYARFVAKHFGDDPELKPEDDNIWAKSWDNNMKLLAEMKKHHHPVKGTGMYLDPFLAKGKDGIVSKEMQKVYALAMVMTDLKCAEYYSHVDEYVFDHLEFALLLIPEETVRYAIDHLHEIRW